MNVVAFFQYLLAHEPTQQLGSQLALAYSAHTPDVSRRVPVSAIR